MAIAIAWGSHEDGSGSPSRIDRSLFAHRRYALAAVSTDYELAPDAPRHMIRPVSSFESGILIDLQ